MNDQISNLEKKIEEYFLTSKPSSAWIQQPLIAEMKDNKQLNLHKQTSGIAEFSSCKDQVQLLLTDGILVQYVVRIS